MYNDTSIHGVKRITATTFDHLESAPLMIRITGKPNEDIAEITLHTYDAAFSLALVAAINKVDEDRQTKVTESKLVEALNVGKSDDEIQF
jgi:hypothetical protein